MKRRTMFSVRLSELERGLITQIAAEMQRNESEAIRQVIREAAHLLGVLPPAIASPIKEGSSPRIPVQR